LEDQTYNLSPPLNQCGPPKLNMENLVLTSFSENASKYILKEYYYLLSKEEQLN